MSRSPTRKRPCRVCKRWFIPHPRLKDRQKTCGDPQCQREWHRRKCEQWNHNNVDYFKDNYLDKKLELTGTPRSRLKTGLPLCYVQAAHRYSPADHHRVPEPAAHASLPPSDSSASHGQWTIEWSTTRIGVFKR